MRAKLFTQYKTTRAESFHNRSVEEDKEECIAPTLSWIAYTLQDHKCRIVEILLTVMLDDDHLGCAVMLGMVARRHERNEETCSAPYSKEDKHDGDPDEFLVKVGVCCCHSPVHV